MRRLLSTLAVTVAVGLSAHAGTGPALAAAGFEAGPSHSVGVVFDDGTWYGEVIGVDATAVSSTTASAVQTVNVCVVYGRSGGPIVDSACGPGEVSVDPFLDHGRIVATLTGASGTIDIDLTVVANSAPVASTDLAYDAMSVEVTGAVSRDGVVSGTISTVDALLAAAGSSWYGQLVHEATADVRLP